MSEQVITRMDRFPLVMGQALRLPTRGVSIRLPGRLGSLAVLGCLLTVLSAAGCARQEETIENDPMFAGIWAREEAIEDCMRERGFEYVAFFDPAEDPAAVEAYPELADRPLQEDPNDVILSGMTAAERAAYDEALWGASAFDPSGGGCLAASIEAAYGFNILDVLPDASTKAEFELAVEADPAMIAAEDEWKECMQLQGFGTDLKRLDFIREINRSLDEFYEAGREQGVDAAHVEGYEAFRSYYDGAYDVDLNCEPDWIRVREEVRAKYRLEMLGPS